MCQIKANMWNFIYIGFEEEQSGNTAKLNCKVSAFTNNKFKF